MINIRILKAYGRAFFETALDEGRLEQVCRDLKAIGATLRSSDELSAFLQNGSINEEKKASIFESLFSGKIDHLTLKLVHFLGRRRRLRIIGALADYFETLYDAHAGIARIVITSAFPLSAPQVKGISDKFASRLGKRIEAELRTDPALLGGFKVAVGDTVYDYSVSHQLEEIYDRMIQ